MAGFRDIKRQARRDLHREMEVPALYLVPSLPPTNPHPDENDPEHDPNWAAGSGPFFETPIPVNVRLHFKFDALGDMKGTSYHYAERQETIPKILFMRDQVDKPARNAIVSIEVGEAYRIDNTLPPDDISVTAEVIKIPAADTVGLPVPESA